MGYDVTGHILRSAPDFARLEALPVGIAWAVYRETDTQAWFVDTFASGKKHDWPFTAVPNLTRLPPELPDTLGPLRRVFDALRKAELTDGFELEFLRLNLLLSQTLRLPVLSIYSDDEYADVACLSRDGTLERLRCECFDIAVTYREGMVDVQPLRIEDDDVALTDLAGLHDPAGGIAVQGRDVVHVPRLHHVAYEEVLSFIGTTQAPLGLGKFDGVQVPSVTVAASAQTIAGPESAPWWKFWGWT